VQALDARVKQKNQAHGRHNTPEKKQRHHAKAAAALSKVAQETHLVIYAMRASLADLLNLLLANKADLNAKDSLGNTCLIYAVRNNDTDMVHLLFTKRRGAAKPGPSSSSSSSSAPPSSLSPAEPELMLENETGIDPNVQDEQGKTALHHVVSPLDYGSYENVALLTMLLKAGADPNVKDNQGIPHFYQQLSLLLLLLFIDFYISVVS
jgi:ankyrin repeat protein